MRELGMAAGHALKLKKRLAELKPPLVSPPVQAKAPTGVSTGTSKQVNFGGTEYKSNSGCAAGSGNLLHGQFDEDESKASFQEAVRAWRDGRTVDTSMPAKSDSLLDGHFDEDEAKASFQEAVRAWREGRDAAESAPAKSESMDVGPRAPLGSFWSKIGGDEVNLERCTTPLTTPVGMSTLQPEAQHDPAPSETKLCCYHCYTQFYAKFSVERCSPMPDHTVRRLCSEACADVWVASMQAKADELQQRQEKFAQLEEVRRAVEYESKSSISGGASGEMIVEA